MTTTTLPAVGDTITILNNSVTSHGLVGTATVESHCSPTGPTRYEYEEGGRIRARGENRWGDRTSQYLAPSEYSFGEAAAPGTLKVGGKARVTANSGEPNHYAVIGSIVTIQSFYRDDRAIVVMSEVTDASAWKPGETNYINLSDLEPVEDEAPTETLAAWKVSFLEGAIARGEANGRTHAEQVKVALDYLARLEYLDPSTTLEDFQKRVVALAMDKKVEHDWCGEPEAFLEEIGLGHMLPKYKYVDVTYRVRVLDTGQRSYAAQREASDALGIADRTGVTLYQRRIVTD